MKRPGPGGLLHEARVHRDLHRMARVGRDDPPADGQPLRLAGDHAGEHGRGLGLHAVLAPPRVGLGEPDRVEAGLVHDARRLEHLLQRLHRQLHHADAERNRHAGPSASCCSSALMMPSTCWLMIGCSTRWPIDAEHAGELDVGLPRHVRVVALAAQRERRRHVHHRAHALALAAHRRELERALLELLEVHRHLEPAEPERHLDLGAPVRRRRRPRSPRRPASARPCRRGR